MKKDYWLVLLFLNCIWLLGYKANCLWWLIGLNLIFFIPFLFNEKGEQ